MIAFLSEFLSYLLEDERLWWAIVGCGYFLAALYAVLSPSRDYPDWFWALYLALSGAILFRVSAGYHFDEAVTVYAEYLLLAVAVAFGVAFWIVITIYASNRREIDDALEDIRG